MNCFVTQFGCHGEHEPSAQNTNELLSASACRLRWSSNSETTLYLRLSDTIVPSVLRRFAGLGRLRLRRALVEIPMRARRGRRRASAVRGVGFDARRCTRRDGDRDETPGRCRARTAATPRIPTSQQLPHASLARSGVVGFLDRSTMTDKVSSELPPS